MRKLLLDQTLKRQIIDALAGFSVVCEAATNDSKPLKRAAVALTLTDLAHGADLPGLPGFSDWQSDSALLLTRRSGSLRSHAGQWALPGGKIDRGETPEQAALRELSEEVGLTCQGDDVLGRLDDVVTRSGYLMTPIVIWAGQNRNLTPNPAEVGSVHRVPLLEFLRPEAPMLSESTTSEHPELRMPIGDSWVAAPTASVLYQFREVCLLGRSTRVDHFEQPRFTWR